MGDVEEGQPWTATTWTLHTLREWGVDASALGDTAARLDRSSRWEYDDLPYWGGEVDACINGTTLATGVWLGADVRGPAAWFLEHQLADGGWNCAWVDGSTRSSFHSTVNAVEGLLWCEEHGGVPGADQGDLVAARRRGMEYLLERGLLRRLSTGEQVGPWATELGYPFRWRYTLLRGLDAVRRAAALDGTGPDGRAGDAVEVLRALRRPDGRWLQQVHHEGQEWFAVDVPVGMPSPWLTLYGTRVLAWWEGGAAAR